MMLKQETVLKQMTHLPKGFSARPLSLDDAEIVTGLANDVAQKYIDQNEVTVAEMVNFWQLPDFDLEASTRVVASPEGKLVAYIDVDDRGSMPVRPNFWGRVHPDYEGLGIGTAILNWAVARARQAIPHVPSDARVTVDTYIWNASKPAIELFEAHGFSHVRDFWRMGIELDTQPAPPLWPDGITLSSFAERPNLRAIVQAMDEAFADHWGHVARPLDELEKNWQHWIEGDPLHDPAYWWLAMDGDEIAGISLCRRQERNDPDMGWVNVLGVRRPYRQKGLGLALLQHSFCEFYNNGRLRAGLGVDASSLTGATRLYEKAGMTVQRHDRVYEKELRPGRDLATQTLDF